jgi:type II secretory pathway pseudopilin PulG
MKEKFPQGFTLIELLMVTGMIAGIIGVITLLYIVGLKTWDAGSTRVRIRESLNQTMAMMVQELRQAKSIDSFDESSITFTSIDFESSLAPPPDATYKYYLYNAADPLPNPPYTANNYSLMRAKNNNTYGAGQTLVKDITRPTSPPFSLNGKLFTIYLGVDSGGQSLWLRTKVLQRN